MGLAKELVALILLFIYVVSFLFVLGALVYGIGIIVVWLFTKAYRLCCGQSAASSVPEASIADSKELEGEVSEEQESR